MLWKLLIILSLFVASPAWAGWATCETGDSVGTAIGPRDDVCYNFSAADATGSVKDFGPCYDVDVVYDNGGSAASLCIDICTRLDSTSCSEITTVCKTGADGDAHYSGLMGVKMRPRLEGSVTGTPQAMFDCN